MMDTSSVFECDYSSGEEAYNYNIDDTFYRGVERKIAGRCRPARAAMRQHCEGLFVCWLRLAGLALGGAAAVGRQRQRLARAGIRPH